MASPSSTKRRKRNDVLFFLLAYIDDEYLSPADGHLLSKRTEIDVLPSAGGGVGNHPSLLDTAFRSLR